jgi:hypothetical protein
VEALLSLDAPLFVYESILSKVIWALQVCQK